MKRTELAWPESKRPELVRDDAPSLHWNDTTRRWEFHYSGRGDYSVRIAINHSYVSTQVDYRVSLFEMGDELRVWSDAEEQTFHDNEPDAPHKPDNVVLLRHHEWLLDYVNDALSRWNALQFIVAPAISLC